MDSLKAIFSRKPQGVGIELTPERVNLARLKKQGTSLKLEALASVELAEGIYEEGQILDTAAMADAIQTVLTESKLKVRQATTAIPGRAITRVIPVPAELDDNELREMVLNQEASLYLPFPREEADVDYQKLGYFVDEDGIEKVQVLLVAVRKDLTDPYIEVFQQAGLALNVLETSSFALIRTIREQLRQFTPQEAAAVVDIEFENTEISIVVDGVPHFSRTVPIGTFQIQSALSRAMNLPPSRNTELLQGMTVPIQTMDTVGAPQMGNTNPGTTAMLRVLGELSDELRRSIDFYLNQGEDMEVAQLLLAGPGASIGQLDEFLAQRLSLPASQIDPISALSLEVAEDIPESQRAGLATVIGLGMREV
ncbi:MULTISPECIES: type IV pilus assembly protein PilM [Cyanophyceae]|uniref:type IV pilus assembly protein PilM n=1 Tax=Cyanophyceae TaxID=3028117 RepID=UPI00168A2495|nr:MULTISPECIES: type IV pilus assembly protein PilM [unclassified Phormidium]MBD1917066.1 type IV pilus assembly protein PilM [Phormidium sp. FACHB-77]MBD2030597.1 type IV pilus assembly protein PilM [Phormidium sp. FACHB-322]MBD2050295.1 type IV pilus assembly protein PilM [Leptolyngbya sp. FACHB-60]